MCRMACQRTPPARQRGSLKLGRIPAVVFPDGLRHLEVLVKAMLESDEYEQAINQAARSMKVRFFDDFVPEQVSVKMTAQLDRKKLFGLTDKDSDKIQISANLCKYLRKNPHNNVMSLFACVIVIHEISHVLIRTALKLKQTPEKFIKDNFVHDFGFFIERCMFYELQLGRFGISFVVPGETRTWLSVNGNYDDAELGCLESRTLLTREYVNELVTSNSWRTPGVNDVVREANFVKKVAVGRRGLDGNMATYTSHCGVSQERTLAR